MRLKLLVAMVFIGSAPPLAAQQENAQFISDTFTTDLPMPELKGSAHRVILECKLADGGKGVLTLDPFVPKFDAFGEPTAGAKELPPVRLEFTLKLIKTEKNKRLFEIRGPKITSKLTLAVFPFDQPLGDARLLVHGKDGEVRYPVSLTERTHRTIPCHPGCFPAGTAVAVSEGVKAIDKLRPGDSVLTIDANGKKTTTRVISVFNTRNRAVTLRVPGAKLITTETQPIALESGKFRAAGELKPGDRIWRWQSGKRFAATVLEVTAVEGKVEVFNLLFDEQKMFIAGGFVVRSKPVVVAP